MEAKNSWANRKSVLGLSLSAATLASLLGVLVGVGGFTGQYAEDLSYFSKDPAACMNCHIMKPQFDSWQKSRHHTAAACIDCHLPHDFLGKYIAKAETGYNHSKAFTLQEFHEPILINDKNSRILQQNCIECHRDFVHEIIHGSSTDEMVSCIHCHKSVGHGETVGLGGPERSSLPEQSSLPNKSIKGAMQ